MDRDEYQHPAPLPAADEQPLEHGSPELALAVYLFLAAGAWLLATLADVV